MLLITIILSVTALTASLRAEGEKDIEIVASCSPWPPYVIDGEKPSGILVDYAENLLREFGYKTRIDIFPWKRAIEAAQSGNVDVIFCAESGQAGAYDLNYEFPILITDTLLLSHRNHPLEPHQLWNRRIALGAGYWYGDVFESRRSDVDAMEVVDDLAILRMVASRRADGGLMEKAVLDNLLRSHPNLAQKIFISKTPVTTQTFFFATSKKTNINLRHLRQHIAENQPKPLVMRLAEELN